MTRSAPWYRDPAAVVVGVALTVALLVDLGDRSLWADEGTTAAYKVSLSAIGDQLFGGEAPNTLYYLLQHLMPFGASEFALRLPSAVAAGAAALVTVRLGRRLFDGPAAVLAGGLFAVHGMTHHYGQEARVYALATLAAVTATWCLVSAVRDGGTARWVRYAVAAALGVYLHLFVGLVLVGHLLALETVRGHRRPRYAGGLAVAAVAVVGVPFVFYVRDHGHVLNWIPDVTSDRFLSDSAELAAGWPRTGLLWVILALWLIGGAVRFRSGRSLTFEEAVVLAWLAVPIALAALINPLQPAFVARYLVVVVPAVALITAAAITSLPRPMASAGALVAIAVMLVGLREWRDDVARAEKQDLRTAVADIAAAAGPGDVLVISPRWLRRGYEYYADRAELDLPIGVARPGQGPRPRVEPAGDGDVFVVRVPFLNGPNLAPLGRLRLLDRRWYTGALLVERWRTR